MELIIELVGHGNRQFDLQPVSAERITIGRAFDNDIILSDPHVCAHHAVLETNEAGEVRLRDLNSVNGTFTRQHQAVGQGCPVASGDEFIVGKTRLRVYRREHAVPPSIRLTWVEQLAQLAGRPVFAGSVFVLAVLLSVFIQYANEIKTVHLGRELITAVGVLLMISIWPAGWMLFARSKKHDARFLAQFSVTIVFVVLVTLLQKAGAWLAFHFGAGLGSINSVLYVLLGFLLIWSNYYLSVFQSNKQRWIYSVSFTALLAGFAYIASTFDAERFKSRPEYSAVLYPPALTIYSTQTVDEYLKNAEGIFSEAVGKLDEQK